MLLVVGGLSSLFQVWIWRVKVGPLLHCTVPCDLLKQFLRRAVYMSQKLKRFFIWVDFCHLTHWVLFFLKVWWLERKSYPDSFRSGNPLASWWAWTPWCTWSSWTSCSTQEDWTSSALGTGKFERCLWEWDSSDESSPDGERKCWTVAQYVSSGRRRDGCASLSDFRKWL
jgi:hypothetical protein